MWVVTKDTSKKIYLAVKEIKGYSTNYRPENQLNYYGLKSKSMV